jgi:hypothetical protein
MAAKHIVRFLEPTKRNILPQFGTNSALMPVSILRVESATIVKVTQVVQGNFFLLNILSIDLGILSLGRLHRV